MSIPAWRGWNAATVREAAGREAPLAVLLYDALDAWSADWRRGLATDRELAALLDAAFVPVAADREAHPGLAALAQQVLGLTADAAGIPCLLVLLPGEPPRPLGAAPYGPLRDGGGRKGLARILLETAEAWRLQPDALRAEADRLGGLLAGLPFVLAGDGRGETTRILALAEAQFMAQAHALEGGFGATPDGAASLPRWPQPEALRLLAALARRDDAAPSLRAHLERSLAALAAGGIRDQLGGGFHRAAADAGWREPLAEQRLADQARLALAFLDGHALTGRPLYRDVAEQTLAFCLRELALAPGRYALGRTATPAYLQWTTAQCAAVVGDDGARLLARRFALGDEPAVPAVRGLSSPDEASRLPALVARLAAARAERPAPPHDERDDLAAHGHLLAALHAAAALPEPLPGLAEARDALHQRLAVQPPEGRAQAAACVALGLAAGGDIIADAWLDHALAQAEDGAFPVDGDALVAPMPRDAEDTVDGPGAAGAVALALAARGRHAGLAPLVHAHAGLLGRVPALAPSLCLALAYSASASR